MKGRLGQVIKYGWQHSKEIVEKNPGFNRISIFFDILSCYRKYKMWSNQYLKESFWKKSKEERETLGAKFRKEGIKRDAWQKDFRENRNFFIKYGNAKYERVSLRNKRNKAYAKRYHAGENFVVEYDVNLSRQHYLNGTISIGNNVLLSKHVTIDYSGELIIKDYVKMADGVIIETHSHQGMSDIISKEDAKQEKLIIEEGALLCAKCIILESCHKIGRHARIGAGAVVRFNVPPYAIVIGNPAKIVGFTINPKTMEEFENKIYSEGNRLDIEEYRATYKKLFSSRLKDIKSYTKRSI